MRNLWVHITAPDRPGILGRFMEGVAHLDLELVDLEHVSVGNLMNLAVGVRCRGPLSEAHSGLTELGLELGVTVALRDEPIHPRESGATELVVTILGNPVPAAALAETGKILADHGANIRRGDTLARRRLHCVELLTTTHAADRKALARDLFTVGSRFDVDLSVQEEGLGRRSKRLVVMDVDSTLIQTEVIDELATEAGVGEQVAAITARAMNGELDFTESLHARVGLLKGLPIAALQAVHSRLEFSPGTRSLIKVLKEMGYRTAILSGGFTYFTDQFQLELGLDYAHANVLEMVDDRLTGRTLGPIVDGPRKADLVREIAATEGIRLDQCIAIGDGANDLPMMDIAGLGIAFNAKPRVRAQAPHTINRKGLDSILFLLGIREEEIERVEAQVE